MTSAPFDRIAIVLNSYFGPFMMELVEILKQEHGSKVFLYCKSETEAKTYREGPHANLFECIENYMLHMPALRDTNLDERTEFSEARKREIRLGLTYNTFAVSNRHVGIGYALGGFYHPGSRYADASYLQMVHAYNIQFEFWENELQKNNISLIIADNKEVAVIAKSLGVIYRTMARARLKNYHYWEEAETREAHAIQKKFNKLSPRTVNDIDASRSLPPYVAGKEIISRAMNRGKWSNIIRQTLYLFIRHAFWVMKGYEKAKGYYVTEQVRMLFRQRRDIRRMTGPETVTLDELEGTPFIFYPLHTEPEQSLGQISPEFFFQQTAIASVSRDLPVGVKLVVKEVPMACGRRPDNFYDQILRLKNVEFLNLAIPGVEVVQRAVGVVTIAGTAGLEAALLGKPVISFGRHNPYNFLQHVKVVKDFSELPSLVNDMLEGKLDLARTLGDAERYKQAIKMSCFDMGSFNYFDLKKFAADAPLNAYKKLCESVLNINETGTVSQNI